MDDKQPYDIQLKPLYGGLEKSSLENVRLMSDHPWFNRTLCRVNESLVRVGVFLGEFHWHVHEQEDEFFFVVDGQLEIELEGREAIRLGPGESVLIPKGVRHRPTARDGATVLMVEPDTVVPTGTT